MRFIAKAFPVGKAAADGSIFPKNVVEEYLNSDRFKQRLAARMILGSVTHAYRDEETLPSKVVAVEDQMLLSQVITHYATDVYIEGDWVYMELEMLDEKSLEDTEAYKWIKFIKALLMAGIRLPMSVAVLARWNKNVCEEIIQISGIDFTLDPGFAGAGVEDIIDKR